MAITLVTALAIIAASASGTASSAASATSASVRPAMTPSRATTASATGPRYCVRARSATSRILRTLCQSREDWMREGFDPVAAR